MAYNDRYGRDDRFNRDRDYRDDDRFRGRGDDRGFIDRAGDEVRSWFGDDDATRRRERDGDGYHFDGRDDRYDRQDNRSDAGFRGTFRRGATSGSDDYGRTHYGASDYGRSSYGDGTGSDRGSRYGSSAPDYGRDRGAGYRGFGGSSESYGQADYGRSSQGYGARSPQHHDDDYRSWRDRQVEAFDRDYDDYRRERQQRFHNEFDTWRTNRTGSQTQQQAEQNGTQWRTKVREHQEVLGSDGEHIGVVDHVQGDRLKLTKRDGDGEHHFIPLTAIVSVDNAVRLNVTADEARRTWRGETGAGGTKPVK